MFMKRLAAGLLVLVIFAVLLGSCANILPPKVEETPTPTPTPDVPATTVPKEKPGDKPKPSPTETPEITASPALDFIPQMSELVYSDTVDVGQGRVLVATGFYPQTGVPVIDSYYVARRDLLIEEVDTWAEEFRTYEDEPDWITEYEISDDYEIIKNSGNILSVHRIYYMYTGGAHGYAGDSCDNFRISDGKRLTLDDIFDCSFEVYKADICAVFDAYIDADFASTDDGYGTIGFFEDAKETLHELFPSEEFCITETGLNFYLSAYYVGPYASGTIEIPVAWADLTVPLKNFR